MKSLIVLVGATLLCACASTPEGQSSSSKSTPLDPELAKIAKVMDAKKTAKLNDDKLDMDVFLHIPELEHAKKVCFDVTVKSHKQENYVPLNWKYSVTIDGENEQIDRNVTKINYEKKSATPGVTYERVCTQRSHISVMNVMFRTIDKRNAFAAFEWAAPWPAPIQKKTQ